MSKENQASAIIDFAKSQSDVQIITLEDGLQIAAIPTNRSLRSLKEYSDIYLKNPERCRGVSDHETLVSFLAHVKRHKLPYSVVFANGDASNPKVTAIYNYNESPIEAHWRDHRAVLNCRISDEWKAWAAQNKKPMNQTEFAEFVESRILDVQDPPDLSLEQFKDWKQLQSILGYRFATQDKIMQLSRGLTVHENSKVGNAVNLASGEQSIVFESEHVDKSGNKIDVPPLFMIAIPVFKDGKVYRMAVRLRYRKTSGGINWSYDIYRIDDGFKNAYSDVCNAVAADTELPVFVGSSES